MNLVRRRPRLAIVCAAALPLAGILVLGTAQAQPGRPGAGAGGVGNPGRPGVGNPNPGPPAGQVNRPNPPAGGFNPGTPARSQLETVWSCEKCGREVGRGPTRPSIDRCPGCGVSFRGSGGWGFGGIGTAVGVGIGLVVYLIRKATGNA